MDFNSLMIDHINRFGTHDIYQELFNTIVEFCEVSNLEKPSAETILSIYGVLVVNRRIKDAE